MPSGLQKKLGPLPIWAWAVVLVGAYLLYRHISGASGTAATSDTTAANNGAAATAPTTPWQPSADSTGGGNDDAIATLTDDFNTDFTQLAALIAASGSGGGSLTGSGTTPGGLGPQTQSASPGEVSLTDAPLTAGGSGLSTTGAGGGANQVEINGVIYTGVANPDQLAGVPLSSMFTITPGGTPQPYSASASYAPGTQVYITGVPSAAAPPTLPGDNTGSNGSGGSSAIGTFSSTNSSMSTEEQEAATATPGTDTQITTASV